MTVVLSTEPRRRQSVLRSRGGPFGARLECVVQQLENPLSRQGQGPGVGLVRVRCHGRHHRTTGHDQPPRTAAVEGTTITGQGVDVSLRDIARRAGPDEFGEHRPPRERRPRARSRRSRACGPGNSAARLSDEVSLGHGQPSGTFAAARGTEEVLVGRRLATRARRGWLWQWLVPPTPSHSRTRAAGGWARRDPDRRGSEGTRSPANGKCIWTKTVRPRAGGIRPWRPARSGPRPYAARRAPESSHRLR